MNQSNKLFDHSVTVLVNTCDAYKDVWPLFFSALKEFWPDRSYKLVVNTETIDINDENQGIFSHNFVSEKGVDKWGLRLIKALEFIETEYVLVLYDDFILEDYIDVERLNRLISQMDGSKDVAVHYLTHIGLNTVLGTEVEGQSLLLDNIDYKLNSSPALWRRKDLIKYTSDNDTPWAWEVFGSYRTYKDEKKFYCPSSKDFDLYRYDYEKGGAIYRGKWVSHVVLPKNIKYNLNMDFSIRGFSAEDKLENRNFIWKMKFIVLGFRMVGLKAFIFIIRYLKAKFL